jgi:hypothetical protein
MNPPEAERAAVRVAAITAVVGGALTAAPARVGPLIGLTDKRAARVVGLADLVLVPGLLRGRPRWPWLAARAGLNAAIVGYALVTARDNHRALLAAAALTTATVADLRSMSVLRASESS